MKPENVILLVCIIIVGALIAFRLSSKQRVRDDAYVRLKALPPVSEDFTTPEGAILCLEDAYRRRDIEAAMAAKDFTTEARLLLQTTGFKDHVDDDMVAKTAKELTASFREHTTANWPDFEGLESYFTKREPYADKIVIVTEVCRFPDEGLSEQQILVVETLEGWRVLNPVSE